MNPRLRGLVIGTFLGVALLSAACTPQIQPIVRDGAGNWLPLLNEAVSEVTEVANFGNPIDAVPSPDGGLIYFTSAGDEGGIYTIPATGGEPTAILVGEPLVTPQGLALSADGQTLFVADVGAGHLWSMPSAGGEAMLVAGTEDTAPVAVETKQTDGGELIYFAGSQGGNPAIWQISASGGSATVVAQGAPLVNPMGLAIANDGTVYVVDANAAGAGLASVFRIVGDQVEPIAENFRAGYQAGAALTLDESVLLVSAVDVETDRAQVLLINLATLDKGIVTKVIAANAGSGGIHRAYNANIFSWADYIPMPIQKPGHVYVVRP